MNVDIVCITDLPDAACVLRANGIEATVIAFPQITEPDTLMSATKLPPHVRVQYYTHHAIKIESTRLINEGRTNFAIIAVKRWGERGAQSLPIPYKPQVETEDERLKQAREVISQQSATEVTIGVAVDGILVVPTASFKSTVTKSGSILFKKFPKKLVEALADDEVARALPGGLRFAAPHLKSFQRCAKKISPGSRLQKIESLEELDVLPISTIKFVMDMLCKAQAEAEHI